MFLELNGLFKRSETDLIEKRYILLQIYSPDTFVTVGLSDSDPPIRFETLSYQTSWSFLCLQVSHKRAERECTTLEVPSTQNLSLGPFERSRKMHLV